MTQPRNRPNVEKEVQTANGRDEMNLAEFPFATLRTRGDRRRAIEHEGWIVDKNGNRLQQKWKVSGSMDAGLPTEFDERVYVALMAISAQHGFKSRKVPFSIYRILKTMGEGTDKSHYQVVERSLDRLKGATIKAEGAFRDNEKKEIVRTVMSFNLIDKYWLRYREKDERIREEEGVPAYIVWSDEIWKSIKANYIKPLDLQFFYSLEIPIARRLYRFLDKRMQYQEAYEIDIFELASRLGMVRYPKPVKVRQKLQPAFAKLIERGFLASAEPVKHKYNDKVYTRIRFVKAPKALPSGEPDEDREEKEKSQNKRLAALHEKYGTSRKESDLWVQVLKEIELATTQATYQAWFPGTHLLALKDGVATIGVPSRYAREWLEGRLAPIIKRALEDMAGQPVGLAFEALTDAEKKD